MTIGFQKVLITWACNRDVILFSKNVCILTSFFPLQAYKKGLYGSNHVWILPGSRLNNKWIRESDKKLKYLNCTMEELLMATNGYFTLNFNLLNTMDTQTVSGKVVFCLFKGPL